MSYDSTFLALQRFNDTEALRASQKAAGEPVAPRVLLKLVGLGSNLHLEARDDTKLERLKTFFMPRAYKLENIKAFISKLPSQNAAVTATLFIDKKIETRKPSFSLFALLQKALFGKTEVDTAKDPFKDASPMNPLFVESPLAKTVPNALFENPTSVQPKAAIQPIGYGMQRPTNACYLNSTSQALRQSPSFKEFLQTRRQELEELLANTGPEATPIKLQIEVQAFSDLVYDKAKTDLPMAIHFVQQYKDESDYANAIVQLALINKLQGIYTKLDSATVDKNTVQSFRTLIITTGFIDKDTHLASQEDAAAMVAHLLTSIGYQPFNFTNAIAYQSNFAIPMLDRQGKNEQSVFPIALMDVAPNTTIQDLVVDRKVDETIEKKDIINSDGFLERNPDELNEILNLQDKIIVQTTQSLTFAKGQEPKLLPVTLKRYSKIGAAASTKNHVPISPSLILEVPITGQKEVARYRLTAVTVHQGSTLDGGHFYTYATKPDGNWIKYDDANVTASTNEEALKDITHNAYVYYYEYEKNVPSEISYRGRTEARA